MKFESRGLEASQVNLSKLFARQFDRLGVQTQFHIQEGYTRGCCNYVAGAHLQESPDRFQGKRPVLPSLLDNTIQPGKVFLARVNVRFCPNY